MRYSFRNIFHDYKEISLRYDMGNKAIWCYFNPQPRPCFSLVMLEELKQMQQSIIDYFHPANASCDYPVHYFILASQSPGVFNLGGDLNLFIKLITDKNREQLLEYAKSCIDICYLNTMSYHLPITTISLVEGLALGGGFEAAMSSNVLIAEKQSELGLPESRFNLFPGMGAYSFLARAMGMNAAEAMISSGKVYTAGQLHKMGIVNVLTEKGEGEKAINTYIRKYRRSRNSLQAIQAVRQLYSPLHYEELLGITKIWVDAALKLKSTDLRKMEKIVTAQDNKDYLGDSDNARLRTVRTRQDRRFTSKNVSFPFTDSSGNIVVSDRRKRIDRRLSIIPPRTTLPNSWIPQASQITPAA